ncbi:MAG: NAD-dependent epimerase/dehydratase family protein [Actinomycetes bacterium]
MARQDQHFRGGPVSRVLVTGGAGFIGSNLVDRLTVDGHEVTVVDDLSSGSRANLEGAIVNGATLVEGDIAEAGVVAAAVAEARPEVIHHLAARASVGHSVADPGEDARVNLIGTLNVLEAARTGQVGRLVYVSTGGAIYGDAAVYPTPETADIGPESPYGVSKYGGELYWTMYAHLHGLSTVTLRLANIYGPRQDPAGEGGVVAIFCRALLDGTKATINGDGLQTRDFVMVDDVVAACLAAGESHVGGSFNVATGEETSVLDLVEALASAGGVRTLDVAHGPARDGEVRRSLLDPSKAREVLEWQASTGLEDGLRRTLAWQAST